MNKFKKVKGIIQMLFLYTILTNGFLFPDLNSDLFKAVKKGDNTKVQNLISKGADVNVRDIRHGLTPLHMAASKGNSEIASTLILLGAEVNKKDKYNAIPLHMAIVKGDIKMTRLLLESGADFNTKDYSGMTPISVADKNGFTEISKLLRRIITEGILEPQSGYRVCHNYPYHLLTGKNIKERVSPEKLHGAIKKNPQYDCIKHSSEITLKDLSDDDLKEGDIIIFGKDHSGVVRQIGKKVLISHFRGYYNWDKKPPVKSTKSYGIYFNNLKQLSQFKTGKRSYGDRKVTICRRKSRLDPLKNTSLNGKWEGVKDPKYITIIGGSGNSISYNGGNGVFQHTGTLSYDRLKQMYYGELKDKPGKCCGNDGEMWLKVEDKNKVSVKSKWWKKGTNRNRIVFKAGWEPLKRQLSN